MDSHKMLIKIYKTFQIAEYSHFLRKRINSLQLFFLYNFEVLIITAVSVNSK